VEGHAFCSYGPVEHQTEKGAPCMGRRETLPRTDKDDEETGKSRYEYWKFIKDLEADQRCHTSCRHYRDGCCTYGPVSSPAQDGTPCMGRKEFSREALFKEFNKLRSGNLFD